MLKMLAVLIMLNNNNNINAKKNGAFKTQTRLESSIFVRKSLLMMSFFRIGFDFFQRPFADFRNLRKRKLFREHLVYHFTGLFLDALIVPLLPTAPHVRVVVPYRRLSLQIFAVFHFIKDEFCALIIAHDDVLSHRLRLFPAAIC